MPLGLDIKITVPSASELPRKFADLRSRITDFREPLDESLTAMQKSIETTMQSNNYKWPPLKASTRIAREKRVGYYAARPRVKKPLQWTRSLFDALTKRGAQGQTIRVTPKSISIHVSNQGIIAVLGAHVRRPRVYAQGKSLRWYSGSGQVSFARSAASASFTLPERPVLNKEDYEKRVAEVWMRWGRRQLRSMQ